ncbi:glycoside hydrolase family 65 protein [Miniimonas arenae]|uniref:Glycoside hydrolase family 65 protein n=1 Tax=Miniimonas arenae TaxID=676201 RepID=A0A5C5BGF2_9MICO|nr:MULTISPECIES: glycosyl hydrolase family 65 protein [Miniimonas]TNU76830.1 glycoside hydrolase family 65 protein [Miniimonas arenae]
MRRATTEDPLDRTRFPADPWALREVRYDSGDLGKTETLFAVGNGYLGLRGNVEEGRDTYAHGTFINGFHEIWPIQHAEDAYGFAKVGQTIVNVPDPKIMRLYVDDEPLLLTVADLERYERTLDFRDGVLTREVLWRTPSGKRVHLRSRRMVSFSERHLAVMDYEITLLDADAPVAISCQILNRQDGQDEYTGRTVNGHGLVPGATFDPRRAASLRGRILEPVLNWEGDGRSVLGYRVAASGMTLAVAADHSIETTDSYEIRTQTGDDLAKHVFRIDATQGTTTRITKVVSYHTSRGVPPPELVDRCRRTLDRVKRAGTESVFAAQRAWLDDFWARSDVEIGGQPELQQAVRWNLFQLIQASARAEGTGIPAKGVTGSGYDGHYFWDTEIYVLPFLTYTSPAFARNALRFRYTLLDAARRRAWELNQRGALYPWRTINGEEASAYYAAGTAQYHIDADISHAVSQYVAASGDRAFLEREAIDILVETARLWADLGFWRRSAGSDGREEFHIHGVTGPDEYTAVVNDNLFTNVMARANLRAAVRNLRRIEREDPTAYVAVCRRLALSAEEIEEFHSAAEAMHVPYDENLGIHPQDDDFLSKELWDLPNTPPDKRPLLLHYHPLVIYRHQVLKQADVVLALFLQGDEFSFEEKLADFEYYDPLTTGDSTLSAVVQSIIAAEVGYSGLAEAYFSSAVYVDLADLHHNADAGVHVASLGGVWNALVAGFGGMRDYLAEWSFDPRLPSSWDHLTFRLCLQGNRLRVHVLEDSITFDLEAGDDPHLRLVVQGEEVVVDRGTTLTVPLRRFDERFGRPSVRDIEGSVREDGSVIRATVPSHPSHPELEVWEVDRGPVPGS